MTTFLVGAISIATVLLFGCVGETITEKAGHLNLGIPGIMCMGTAGGCLGVSLYMSTLSNPDSALWILIILNSLLLSVVFSALTGAIYAFLTVTLKCNQNITGLAITTFGSGFTQFIMDAVVDRTHFGIAGKIFASHLPFADKLGAFGDIVFGHGIFVYLSIAIAIVASFILKKTRLGLHLRAVGENPATADAAGINVTLYKYGAILVGSSIAGFGGLFYIMDYIKGSWENAYTIEAFGWLAIALVIFTLWKPSLSILGALVFGALYIVAFVVNDVLTAPQQELMKMLPYVVTIIVLVITSMRKKREDQPPASLGLPYFREER